MQKLKKLTKNKVNIIFIIYLLVIFFGLFYTKTNATKETFFMPISKKVIILDAGHGGFDPGKVGKNNLLEKDINLSITKKLQTYLEQSGSFILNTRTDDTSLSDKKREDLKARKIIASNSDADLFISIHQNSFPKENVKGAQVFYYEGSKESEKLAHFIQKRLKSLDINNNRNAKANKQYYLLKKTTVPAVIIECGFLSNKEESEKLNSKDYQEKVAWAIYLGILDYFRDFEDVKDGDF